MKDRLALSVIYQRLSSEWLVQQWLSLGRWAPLTIYPIGLGLMNAEHEKNESPNMSLSEK